MSKINRKNIILLSLFATYLIVLFKITLLRDPYLGAQRVNLAPFTTIAEYTGSMLTENKIIGAANLLGNIVLFFPLGYMSAALFPKARKLPRILFLSFAFSGAIEILQYISARGTTDVDDIILNMLGGAAGCFIYLHASKLFKAEKHTVLMGASLVALACTGLISFGSPNILVSPNVPGLLRDGASNEHTLPADSERPDADVPSGEETEGNGQVDEKTWSLILVNKWNALPDDYEVELAELPNGQLVDERIYHALLEMLDAAREAGVYPVVVSGYRTDEKQQLLMDTKVAEYRMAGHSAKKAEALAASWVAVPGTSEHQLGLAVDINADGINSAGYEVYDWLDQNAHKFGFICRYPSDKTEITGVINEPWHYRYVGVEPALEIYSQGLCLEEYIVLMTASDTE